LSTKATAYERPMVFLPQGGRPARPARPSSRSRYRSLTRPTIPV